MASTDAAASRDGGFRPTLAVPPSHPAQTSSSASQPFPPHHPPLPSASSLVVTTATDAPLPTPNHFLLEVSQLSFTPAINYGGRTGEPMNPFEASFASSSSPGENSPADPAVHDTLKKHDAATRATDNNSSSHAQNSHSYSQYPNVVVPNLRMPSSTSESQGTAEHNHLSTPQQQQHASQQPSHLTHTTVADPANPGSSPPPVRRTRKSAAATETPSGAAVPARKRRATAASSAPAPSPAPAPTPTPTRARATAASSRPRAAPSQSQSASDGSDDDGGDGGDDGGAGGSSADPDARRRRFLERNRLAASKCRQKKKQFVQELERRSIAETEKNRELAALVAQLREEVVVLRNQLLLHRGCGCGGVKEFLDASLRQMSQASADFVTGRVAPSVLGPPPAPSSVSASSSVASPSN
ncbi:hypothetical protein DFJ73DRAFT_763484 [Zopfochytrium polystomum]|nr:hypothetical protein DFJ73DRAFT_763484 [Zopfochytrium polystomum]